MKKLLFIFTAIVVLNSSSFAQAYTDSWSLGFGATVPRFVGTDINGHELDYGGFLSIQRNLTEHSAFRFKAGYLQIKSFSTAVKNTSIPFGFDFLYEFVPCEAVSPYIGLGIAGNYFKLENVPAGTGVKNDSYLDYQANLIFGVNWGIAEEWKIKTELGHHTTSTDKFDGHFGPQGGTIGGGLDNYFTFELGALYYFSVGEKSKLCDLYSGITAEVDAKVDYDKIEEIVKKYSQKTADIDYNKLEDIIKKHSGDKAVVHRDKWILVGVNFEFNKSTLTPESYPILVNAVQVLLGNPEMNVEIQGHTDNIGSETYNKKLSLQRAEIVKKFLVAKGVNANRLTTVGLGSSQPISDNKTADGRAFNRRIEFKVK